MTSMIRDDNMPPTSPAPVPNVIASVSVADIREWQDTGEVPDTIDGPFSEAADEVDGSELPYRILFEIRP